MPGITTVTVVLKVSTVTVVLKVSTVTVVLKVSSTNEPWCFMAVSADYRKVQLRNN